MILVNAKRARNPGEGSGWGQPQPTGRQPPPFSHPLFAKDLFISSLHLPPHSLPFLCGGETLSSSHEILQVAGEEEVGTGNSNLGRVRTPAWLPPGSAGRVLRVEGRADGPATFLPPIIPPSPASRLRAAAGRKGGAGALSLALVRTSESRGRGGHRASGRCYVFFARASPLMSSPFGRPTDAFRGHAPGSQLALGV